MFAPDLAAADAIEPFAAIIACQYIRELGWTGIMRRFISLRLRKAA